MGPLAGLRVVEVASIGPGPFAAMMLSDMGAEVVRITRTQVTDHAVASATNPLYRGRPTIGVDLKTPDGREFVLALCKQADALIEGFRPGVMERLGLGPAEALDRNPRLTYGRVTGYGQDGPLARSPGHDINYIAIAGILGSLRRSGQPPLFPMNLLGDFGGGGMLLAFGVVCAVLSARATGLGQVVDAAMVDGTALLSTLIHGLRAEGQWTDEPGTNLLDSGAPFYNVYETLDGRFMAVGALEPAFYADFVERLGFRVDDVPQWDKSRWPELKSRFAEIFRTKSRAEWSELFEGTCVTPVLELGEAPLHPHNRARGTFVEWAGYLQPAPAPRFSRTPVRGAEGRGAIAEAGRLLEAWGVDSTWRALFNLDDGR